MKKVFLTLTFVFAFVLGTIATPVETIEKNVTDKELQIIYPDASGKYHFSGEIVWDGDYGYASFIYVGESPGSLQIRQIENNYITLNTSGDTVTIIVNKNEWMNFGSPSYVSFSAFKGYSTWANISLIVPPAN